MSDSANLKRIEKRIEKLEDMLAEKLAPLAGIEAHLGDLVNRPAPLKTMEARLEVAEKAKSEVEAEIVKEITKETKRVFENIVNETGSDPISGNDALDRGRVCDPKDIQKGVWVLIESEDPQHAAKNGLTGQVVSRSSAWATIQVTNSNNDYSKGDTCSIRPKDCLLIKHDEEAVVENDMAPIPSLEYTQTENPKHCGNCRVSRGIHKGKTFHMLFNEGDNGARFLDYLANKSTYPDDEKLECGKYLALRKFDSKYQGA